MKRCTEAVQWIKQEGKGGKQLCSKAQANSFGGERDREANRPTPRDQNDKWTFERESKGKRASKRERERRQEAKISRYSSPSAWRGGGYERATVRDTTIRRVHPRLARALQKSQSERAHVKPRFQQIAAQQYPPLRFFGPSFVLRIQIPQLNLEQSTIQKRHRIDNLVEMMLILWMG